MQTNGEFSITDGIILEEDVDFEDDRERRRLLDKLNGRKGVSRIHFGGSNCFSDIHGQSGGNNQNGKRGANAQRSSERNSTIYSRESIHYETKEEIDAILQPLKEMYGVDDAGIKASRSLKSPEDVAKGNKRVSQLLARNGLQF
jgi:hypothetical protein